MASLRTVLARLRQYFLLSPWQRVQAWLKQRNRREQEPSQDDLPDEWDPVEEEEQTRTLSGSLPEQKPPSTDWTEEEPAGEEPRRLSPVVEEAAAKPLDNRDKDSPEEPIAKTPAPQQPEEEPAESKSTNEGRSSFSPPEESDERTSGRQEEVLNEDNEEKSEPQSPFSLPPQDPSPRPPTAEVQEQPAETNSAMEPEETRVEPRNWPDDDPRQTEPVSERAPEEFADGPAPQRTPATDEPSDEPEAASMPIMDDEDQPPPLATPGATDRPVGDEEQPAARTMPETDEEDPESEDKSGDWAEVLNAAYKASRAGRRSRPDSIEERQERRHQRQATKRQLRRARLGLPIERSPRRQSEGVQDTPDARAELESPDDTVPAAAGPEESEVEESVLGGRGQRAPPVQTDSQPASPVTPLPALKRNFIGSLFDLQGAAEAPGQPSTEAVLPLDPATPRQEDEQPATADRLPEPGAAESEATEAPVPEAVAPETDKTEPTEKEAGQEETKGVTSQQADKMIELLRSIQEQTEGIPEALLGVQDALGAVADALPNAGAMV